ncbi:MAG: alpha/beta hydrolase [Ktedonobacteraceae bacterium]|nr:alpha/beta hydrolase [Ktedonobacteraceae bacterium]
MNIEKKQTWALLGGLATLSGMVALRKRRIDDPTVDYTIHGFKRHSLLTPAGRMNYYEAGSGQPLLFLHGIGGGASSWTWSKVAPAFVNQYRVIVPDWVGWGVSEHPHRYLLFPDYVDQLDALLQHIEQPAHVVAQSIATGFAASLAQTTPERFSSLALMTPSGGKDFGRDTFKPIQRNTLTPLARTAALNLILYRALFHRRFVLRSWLESQGFFEAGAVSREIVDGFLYSARQPGAAYSAIPFLSGDLRYDIVPYLHNLRVPSMILWGTRERTVGRQTGEQLAALYPNISFTFIKRARATFELELPAQTIALIQQFLQDTTKNVAYPLHASYR